MIMQKKQKQKKTPKIERGKLKPSYKHIDSKKHSENDLYETIYDRIRKIQHEDPKTLVEKHIELPGE